MRGSGGIARHGGLETVGLRYFTVYGPRQRPDMAMRRLCETAIGGPSFELYGDGEQSRDFTFVADAVDATVRSMTTENVDPILNIGGGQEASMNQVISIIQRLAGRRLLVERMSTQRGDVQRTCADTTVARRQLGWRPSTSLHEGLAAELEFVSERRAAMASSGAVLAAVGSA
ncbi:MAG: GDP-mannose 4,6-dehydratase [Acidimicrobiales bacterium]